MLSYDPSKGPDRRQWLVLGELERLDLVLAYHEPLRATLPNARLHAALHVTVENQLAEGYQPVVETLARLLDEGLDRHEAVHAIGSVAAGELQRLIQSGKPVFDRAAYDRGLAALTAEGWNRGAR